MKRTLNRREFLAYSALGVGSVAFRSDINIAAGQTASKAIVVDTHVHCFAGANDTRFPYHPQAPYRPPEPATPRHLLKCMDDAGVAFAVIVHPEPYQDDHRYLEYCLGAGKGRLKGTCLLFADRPGSAEKLSDLSKRLGVVAVRIHAYAPDRLPPFGKTELRQFWKRAAENNIAVQLHFEPRYAPGFEPLIREFNRTKVIIDHLGRPFQGTPEEHDKVIRWSAFENTIMKISALPSAQTYPHRDVGPIIKRLTQEFGADRLIYGGGYGADADGQSYRATIERARSHLAHLTTDGQAKVFSQNAARLFAFV